MTRSSVRIAAVVLLLALATGVAIMAGGVVVWGDWYLIRLPWGEIGMWLITFGLGGSFVFLIAELFVEPVGRWRPLVLPGIAIGVFCWIVLLVFGLGAGGACCDQPSRFVPTLLYSAPSYILLLTVALAWTALPLVIAAAARRGR